MNTTMTIDTPSISFPNGASAHLPALTCQLPDGRTGWFQRDGYDCLRAAVATLLQIDYDDAPEAQPHEPAFREWARDRGLAVRVECAPVDWDGPYIAVERTGADGFRHTVVAVGDAVLFDPRDGWQLPDAMTLDPIGPIEYAISFAPLANAHEVPAGNYGVIRASGLLPTPTTFVGLDDFDTATSGDLNGNQDDLGTTWSADTAFDFTANGTVQNASTGGTALAFAHDGTATYAGIVVQVDTKYSATPAAAKLVRHGVVARYSDTDDFVGLVLGHLGAVTPHHWLAVVVDGTPIRQVFSPFFGALDTWYTIRLAIDASGRLSGSVWAQGGEPASTPTISLQASKWATGGAQASGRIGLVDGNTDSTAITRTYDNFRAWEPGSEDEDLIMEAGGEAHVASNGTWRANGDGFGSVVSNGTLPRIPAGDSKVLIRASAGIADESPDYSLGAPAVRVLWRPSYLFPPR